MGSNRGNRRACSRSGDKLSVPQHIHMRTALSNRQKPYFMQPIFENAGLSDRYFLDLPLTKG